MSRICGPCQACCEVMAVRELGKKEHTRCERQCAAGCATYATRPPSCAAFRCAWLAGRLGRRDRPDLVGVFVSEADTRELGHVVQVHETRHGASDSGRGAVLLEQIRAASGSRCAVVLVRYDGKRRVWDRGRIVGRDLSADEARGRAMVARVV